MTSNDISIDDGYPHFMPRNGYDLIISASQGRLWMVKKCIQSGIHVDFENGAPLQKAVQNGRTSVVKYLLESGANARNNNVLTISCQKGHVRICKLLISHGALVNMTTGKYGETLMEKPLLDAIYYGNTTCVQILIESGANVLVEDNLPLVYACRFRLINIVKMVLEAGADVNARRGQPLIESCQNGSTDIVDILIKNGADVNINDSQPLLEAAKNMHILVIIHLLNNGADRNTLDESRMDEITLSIIDTFTKKSRIPRLLRAIHESIAPQDFKWQEFCSTCGNLDMRLLIEQAKLFGIPYKNMSKREICVEFAKDFERSMQEKKKYDDNFSDLSGTPINDLPSWKIMVIENIPFNCFDLFKLVKKGMSFNPYTKNELPLVDIREKEDFLRRILTKERFKNFDLLQRVKDLPVLNDVGILANRLENEVWDKLSYPPSINIFMEASDITIDNMVTKMLEICNSRPWYRYYLLNNNASIYPMITNSVIDHIKEEKGLHKKREFLNLLSHIVNYTDEHQDTRIVLVSILFRHFSSTDMDLPDTMSFMINMDERPLYDDLDDISIDDEIFDSMFAFFED